MTRSKIRVLALAVLLGAMSVLAACGASSGQSKPQTGKVDKEHAYRGVLRAADGEQEALDEEVSNRVAALPQDWFACEDTEEGLTVYVDRDAGFDYRPADTVSDFLTCRFKSGLANENMIPLVGFEAEKLRDIAAETNEQGNLELTLTYEEGYLDTVWETLEEDENLVVFLAFLRNGLRRGFFEQFDRMGDSVKIHTSQSPKMEGFYRYLLQHEDGIAEDVTVNFDAPVRWEDPEELSAGQDKEETRETPVDPRMNPTHTPGALQVAMEELGENCHRIYYRSGRRSTFDERDLLYGCIQERMEQLEIPYALGRDEDERLVVAYNDPEGSCEEERELLRALLSVVAAQDPNYRIRLGDMTPKGLIQLVDIEDDSITLYPDQAYYDDVYAYLEEHPTQKLELAVGDVLFVGRSVPLASITYDQVKDRAYLKFTDLYFTDPKILAYLRSVGAWDLSFTMQADFAGQG